MWGVCVCKPIIMWRSEDLFWEFSPSTMCAPETEFRSPFLAASTFPRGATLLNLELFPVSTE